MPIRRLRQKLIPKKISFQLLLFALFLSCLKSWSLSPPEDIRSVDFKNFSYPWIRPNRWPDHLQWMSLRLKDSIRLTNGRWDERDERERADNVSFSGLTLEGVEFAMLSRERSEDAIVVLRYDSGGTQYHYWVYIYASVNGKPKLLGFFHAGDRAANGLYRVFGKNQALNVLLFDPKFQMGDCCSSGYLHYQFRWNGRGFEAKGVPVPGHTESTSRRAVSIFGLPIDPR